MRDRSKAVDIKIRFDGSEVKPEQVLKDAEIIFRKMIDRAVARAHAFCSQRERIFVGQQQERQVIVPQIRVEPVLGGDVQKAFDLGIDAAHQLWLVAGLALPVPEDLRQLQQDAVLAQIAVKQQLRCFTIHSNFLNFPPDGSPARLPV